MKKIGTLLLLSLFVIMFASACGPGPAQPTPPPPTEPPGTTPPPAVRPSEAPRQPPPGSGTVRDDIPVMPNPSNLVAATTPGGHQVTYDAVADLTAAVDFYQTEMPKHGWTHNASTSVVTSLAASLLYTKGGETALVALTPAAPAGTLVAITVSEVGAPVAQPTEAPGQPPAGSATVRDDLPVMPDATNLVVATVAGEHSVTYNTASDLNAAVDFYQAEMPKQGWTYNAAMSAVTSLGASLSFSKGSEMAIVAIAPATGIGTVVVITISGGGAPVAQPTEAPGQPPAGGATVRDDLPITADATNIIVATVSGEYNVTYESATDLTTVAGFYQAEMPNHGWTYNATLSVVTSLGASLYFTKGSETALVSLAPATGGGTVVVVQIH